jgi:peptidoglycan/LPS O-acetylase OafA/YrhL
VASTPGRAAGGVVTALIVGLLVFRFVEEPARRWLRGRTDVGVAQATR